MHHINGQEGQLFEQAVSTVMTEPVYGKFSSVPEIDGTIPVFDLDDRERFHFLPCRLGYYPLNRSVEVGLLELNECSRLPSRVVDSRIALGNDEPFDGLVVARKGIRTVVGLREPGEDWRQVPGHWSTNRSLLEIIRRKVHHPWYKCDGNGHSTRPA